MYVLEPNKKIFHFKRSKPILTSTKFLLFLTFIIFITNVESRHTISQYLPSCSASGAWVGATTQCSPCVWSGEEQFFGEGESLQAEQACISYLQGYNPDVTQCDAASGGIIGGGIFTQGTVEQPNCSDTNPETLLHFVGARMNYLDCPLGTTLDLDDGCVENEDDRKMCGPVIGNPINTATGNKLHEEVIQVGNGLNITLKYNSHLRVNSRGRLDHNYIAPGWTLVENKQISPIHSANGLEYVFAERGNGRYIRFTKNGPVWTASVKDKEILEKTATGWKYIAQNGAIELYNLKGNIQSIEHNNQTINYQIKANEFVNKITNQHGNYITLANYAFLYVYTVFTAEDGRAWTLNYSDLSNGGDPNKLISITYPDNTVKTFHYEDARFPHALTGITDRRGVRYATYEYEEKYTGDTDGRVVKEWHHAQDSSGTEVKVEELSIDYNVDNTRTITNSRGKVSTYTVVKNNDLWQIADITGPGCSNCSNANTSFVYDPATNDLITKTVDGQTTKYMNYDTKGQYALKIEAFGSTEPRSTGYIYDPRFFNKPIAIYEESVHAGNNKVTTYTYDEHANVLSMNINGYKTDGTPLPVNTTTYQYDGPFNQISQIDEPRSINDITIFEYYDGNQVNNSNRLQRVLNAEGIIIRDNIQYTATGKVLSEDKPNGLTTSYTYYPGNDRLETVTNTDGAKTIVTHMDYLATGEIKEITRNYGTAIASKLTLTYDNARRLIRVTDAQGNYVKYTLDTEGNQLSEETRDVGGNLKKLMTQVFDDYDQIDTSTQSGVTNDMDYGSNGNLYEQTNGNGVITDYDYDALNRLTHITQDFNGNTTTANTITQFEYDVNDRVNKVTDANNHDTNYEYDDLGRLTKLTSPDTGIDVLTYDAAGNVLSKTNANGHLTSFTYDALNRPTSIDYVGTDLDVSFVYDQTGAGFSNGINQLTSFNDSKSTTTLSYDSFGNLTNKTQVINNVTTGNNVSQGLSYSFDNYNRLQTMTYPSGLVVTYQYNTLNQVTNVSTVIDGQAIDIVDQVKYLPMGPITDMNLGNGLVYLADYDNGYRLENYEYGTTQKGIYSYDNNHNISSIDTGSFFNNKTYQYDSLDKLKEESGGPLKYTYDKLGNRTSTTYGRGLAIPYIYDANSNKLLNVDNQNKDRSYDANGNTLSTYNYLHRFTYNKANRMDTYSDINKTLKAEYIYNGIGQRIHKKQYISGGNKHNLYIYNANGQLLTESILDNSGAEVESRETIWLGNKPIAQVRTATTATSGAFGMSSGSSTSTDIYYILTDHLNTPRKVTDDSGTVLWSWNSDAFGTTLANEDVDNDGTNFVFNLRFPGQYFDKESGQHYNYFRDYEPGTGRYLESDPIGLYGGWNTFGYSLNNSIRFTDFAGLGPGPIDMDGGWGLCAGLDTSPCPSRPPIIPPATPKQKCERKCWLVAQGSCAGVSFYAGRQAFAVCMATTGFETLGGSTPVCLGVAGVTGRAIGQACKVKFKQQCELTNRCCDR